MKGKILLSSVSCGSKSSYLLGLSEIAYHMGTKNRFYNYIFSSHRLNSSRRAVGAVIDLTKAILANQIGNGAALFRPAGINAEKDRSFNGEFFNSIAAVAKWIRHGYS